MARGTSPIGRWRGALCGLAALALVGCDALTPTSVPVPPERPEGLADATPSEPSARSEDLRRYYLAVQNDLLARGLMRTDGGGPDTPFSADDLARNFETIAFFDEYSRNGTAARAAGQLSRWSGPVRITAEFGPSVSAADARRDTSEIAAYARRLARVSGHPVSTVTAGANFTVFVAGEDDQAFLENRLRALLPAIRQSELDIFLDLPRSIYCLVVAFSGSGTPHNYTRAIALIRSEHPDLVRRACIHEEVAQGLGLANDSLQARPSIFNDDDEFALLTNHDELLLQMLYDPRLRHGMTADEARPAARIIARDLMGLAL